MVSPTLAQRGAVPTRGRRSLASASFRLAAWAPWGSADPECRPGGRGSRACGPGEPAALPTPLDGRPWRAGP